MYTWFDLYTDAIEHDASHYEAIEYADYMIELYNSDNNTVG